MDVEEKFSCIMVSFFEFAAELNYQLLLSFHFLDVRFKQQQYAHETAL